MGFVVLTSAFFPPMPLGPLLLNLCLFPLFLAVLLPLHEAAHALSAWELGLRVFRIRIGSGPVLWAGRLGRTHAEVRLLPVSGSTFIGHPDIREYRTTEFLTFLSGPLLHGLLLLFVLGWPTTPAWVRHLRRWEPDLLPGPIFVAVNVIMLVVSLLPNVAVEDEQVVPSDGLRLFQIPALSQAEIEEGHARYFSLEGAECLKAGQILRAVEWFEHGLQLYPADPVNGLLLGLALIRMREYDRAREHLVELVNRPGLPADLQAHAADALATALLGIVITDPGRPKVTELLSDAERCCEEAASRGRLLSVQTRLSIEATRGCILIEQGKTEEGGAILRDVLDSFEDAEGRAYCLGYLAVAAARDRQRAEGRKYLEMAREFDPECVVLHRATRELERADRP
jgi:tetratricopeptide (TPR) repeat protein